jgi:ribosome-associated toxin RatA of RatAB toxin-antitoxin module
MQRTFILKSVFRDHLLLMASIFNLFVLSAALPVHGANKFEDRKIDQTEQQVSPGAMHKKECSSKAIVATAVVNAPSETVWQAIKDQRLADPSLEYSKVLENNGNTYTLQEKMRIPLIGLETITLHIRLTPGERIKYSLMDSNRFKCYDGSWQITPIKSGDSSLLRLSHHTELNLAVPGFLLRKVIARKVSQRLLAVKTLSESRHLKATYPTRQD